VAAGSLEVKWIVPRYPYASLPEPSFTLMVIALVTPTVRGVATPETVALAAAGAPLNSAEAKSSPAVIAVTPRRPAGMSI
jgi:hypothetical protein